MEMADDTWASLLPDLLLYIFCRLETTAVIRCAGACKPWRRAIIGNASRLRDRPDRFNPNLLVGFFHHSWSQGVARARSPPPPVTVSLTTVDTGHCRRLSSLIPAASAGGVDLSTSRRILASHDGLLLLLLHRRRSKSNHGELCLCNPMSQDCTFLPLPSISTEEECEYTIVTGTTSVRDDDHGEIAVRILAKAGTQVLCTEEDGDRLTYQVFSCGAGGDGAGMWGPVQHSEEVKDGRWMLTYGRSTVVGRDAVYWLAGPRDSGCGLWVTCAVGLDIYTSRAWATKLPFRCEFLYDSTTPCALTTSGNGRLSLLRPPMEGRHIKVWVLDGDGDAMEWTVQHKIRIDVPSRRRDDIFGCQFSNVVCPRSGFLFVLLISGLLQRIDLDTRARKPVKAVGKRGRYHYYPYEMDWSTYISKMKNF